VDEQHDQDDLRVVRSDGMRNVLEDDGLPRLEGRHDQTALPLADRRDDIDDPAGQILFGFDVTLEGEGDSRVQRGQVLEQDLVLGVLGRLGVDLVDLDQREVALPVFRRSDLPLDGVAGMQVEATYLRWTDVYVVRPGKV